MALKKKKEEKENSRAVHPLKWVVHPRVKHMTPFTAPTPKWQILYFSKVKKSFGKIDSAKHMHEVKQMSNWYINLFFFASLFSKPKSS